ncbi:DUF2179 domain-containing protein [Deinococcus radiophilus]|uniref:UPF0316 protein EJ104_01600 n=1 Tax=Deinococcus radiophilus TaxID=32062 RepID=A0A3S0KGU2_9DEIO|nr:DUF5698 domain-containing protein [Deinococcus radiophilus]RTR30232.1 DUF2179 domain-containing protein [Deinococcus radiophilus]UFA49978.1 DUF5698 domain-containing protein [Deinococcus radiophilus]
MELSTALLLNALMIFSLRIIDVSLGTLRIGMIVRGRRNLAAVLSFFESLIWLVAAAQVLGNLESPVQFVAYAGGYAAGTLVGAWIEQWLAVGKVVMRAFVPVNAPDVAAALRSAGYYVTALNGSGRDGDVRVLFSVIPRKQSSKVLRLIEEVYPKAFVTIEEVNTADLQEAAIRQERMARRFRVQRK